MRTALEVGERRGLDDLVTPANAALGVLYGIAGRYGYALAVAEPRLARAETRSRQELVDALRTAAVVKITIKGDFGTGLELARRCHALTRDAVAHQRMHVTWPLLAALYHLGRWEEMFPSMQWRSSRHWWQLRSRARSTRSSPARGRPPQVTPCWRPSAIERQVL